MASACVNNSPAALPSYRWLNPKPDPQTDPKKSDPGPVTEGDGSAKDLIDFEFRLDDDPVAMITADELFSDGKLVPLQLTSSRPLNGSSDPIRTTAATTLRAEIACLSDPSSASSPKAPKCSSRWREILGLKKKPDPNSRNPNPKSFKNLLHRNPRSASIEPSLSLPLLRDSDSDSLSLSSSRLSLSSTSSSSDSCDIPRLSLDSEKPTPRSGSGLSRTGPSRIRTRPVRRAAAAEAESPRMNSSGKVVFYSGSLERSSSSPGSFNGGPRVRARGMERSFSANVVRVNPVLNVPVCSLRRSANSGSVFGFFSGQKKNGANGNGNGKVRSDRASRE